jgi:hypothetical protein
MTGVAQKVRQEFEEQERRIAKEEADARRKRLDDYENEQRKVQADTDRAANRT